MIPGAEPKDIPLDLTRSGPPALIVVGRTGAGKSTLINQMFGKTVAVTGSSPDVTQGIDVYKVPSTGLTVFDTPGAGGLDETTEGAMRTFLQLDLPARDRKSLPADVVIFLFSHDRVTRFDFEFFKQVDAIYRARLLLVKNTKSTEVEADQEKNVEAIEARTARKPLVVDALGGMGTHDVIRECLRLLPASRLLEFNRSLASYRRRARAMARTYATKYAAVAVVERGTVSSQVRSQIQELRNQMYQAIAQSYVDDIVIAQKLGDPARITVESNVAESQGRAAAGGILGGLLGLLGGPIGAAIVGFLGAIFGAATTPRRVRGGSQAATEMFAYALGISSILEKAASDPHVFFTRNPTQVNSWLDEHRTELTASIEDGRSAANQAIQRIALSEFLDHPNTTDRAVVEDRLSPVASALFP